MLVAGKTVVNILRPMSIYHIFANTMSESFEFGIMVEDINSRLTLPSVTYCFYVNLFIKGIKKCKTKSVWNKKSTKLLLKISIKVAQGISV